MATYSQPPVLFVPDLDLDRSREEIGFTTLDIEREASVLAPPRRVVVADTTVTPDAVRTALTTDPVWSAELTKVDGADGASTRATMTPRCTSLALAVAPAWPVRPPRRRGLDHATVVQTLTADDMQAALATADGSAPSVLDTGPFAAAGRCSTMPASPCSAIGVPGSDPVHATARRIGGHDRATARLAPQLVPYASILVVEVVDPDDTPRTEIEVTHSDDASAAANAQAMAAWLADGTDPVSGRPLSELLPGATVEAVGPVIRVVVDGPGHYHTATDMLLNRVLFPV